MTNCNHITTRFEIKHDTIEVAGINGITTYSIPVNNNYCPECGEKL